MCCLRYEFEAYKDFKSRAPKKKTLIDTPLGKARIQNMTRRASSWCCAWRTAKSLRSTWPI
ncbi:MAG: hypothetical protein ACLTYW_07390 [Collinsella sp.]